MEGRKSHQILSTVINPDNSLSSSQSSTSLPLSREDILQIYDKGPDAVVALTQTLCAIIIRLEERVKSLEDQTNKNSRNSSKPPSTDTFQKIKGQRSFGLHVVGRSE